MVSRRAQGRKCLLPQVQLLQRMLGKAEEKREIDFPLRLENSRTKMGTMQIRKYPDSILRQECQAVAEIMDKEIRLFEDMLTTMRSSQGIGLAAPQVGINKRIIVIDIGEGPIKIANPEIIKLGKAKESMGEGCLSVPDAIVDVSRPSEVIIKGLNEKNRPVEIKAKGLLARVILHELDHLNGKLIVDYMSFLRKIDYRLKTRNKLHM